MTLDALVREMGDSLLAPSPTSATSEMTRLAQIACDACDAYEPQIADALLGLEYTTYDYQRRQLHDLDTTVAARAESHSSTGYGALRDQWGTVRITNGGEITGRISTAGPTYPGRRQAPRRVLPRSDGRPCLGSAGGRAHP